MASASKQRADKQKEKEKREKIILAGLVGVLVIVGIFELPKVLKSGKNTPAATTSQVTSSSPGVTSGATAASGPVAAGSLPDPSDYKAGAGQLNGFSLFSGGDPFGNASTTPSGSTTTATTTPTIATTATTPKTVPAAASISINGAAEVVLLKGTFPAASPTFVLDSVTKARITVSVNGGSFSSGQGKVTIKRGASVVLVNTVDSMRYSIKYLAPLSASEALSQIGSTTSNGTTDSSTTGSSTASTSGSTTG